VKKEIKEVSEVSNDEIEYSERLKRLIKKVIRKEGMRYKIISRLELGKEYLVFECSNSKARLMKRNYSYFAPSFAIFKERKIRSKRLKRYIKHILKLKIPKDLKVLLLIFRMPITLKYNWMMKVSDDKICRFKFSLIDYILFNIKTIFKEANIIDKYRDVDKKTKDRIIRILKNKYKDLYKAMILTILSRDDEKKI